MRLSIWSIFLAATASLPVTPVHGHAARARARANRIRMSRDLACRIVESLARQKACAADGSCNGSALETGCAESFRSKGQKISFRIFEEDGPTRIEIVPSGVTCGSSFEVRPPPADGGEIFYSISLAPGHGRLVSYGSSWGERYYKDSRLIGDGSIGCESGYLRGQFDLRSPEVLLPANRSE